MTKEFQKYSEDFKDSVTVILKGGENGDLITDCTAPRAHTGKSNHKVLASQHFMIT